MILQFDIDIVLCFLFRSDTFCVPLLAFGCFSVFLPFDKLTSSYDGNYS